MSHLIENVECIICMIFGALLIAVKYFSINIPSSAIILLCVGVVAVVLGAKDILTIGGDEHGIHWKVLGIAANILLFFIAAIYSAETYNFTLPIPQLSQFISYLILPAVLIVDSIFWLGLNWFSE